MNQTSRILEEVKKAVCGKDRVLVWVLTVLLARGHVLLEDIPGVGKTTMALAFSRALGLDYGRVQFTPDVLPSDITGYSVYQKESGKLVYQPGAVLCNLFLADELNRATSRTQSALLEAMEEGQVTVDGVSHPIPQPFIVFATQNPTGAAGTQLLPDSQMDRFTVRLSIGYPEPADECSMVLARQGVNPLQTVEQVLSRQELVAMQDEAAAVYIKKELVEYIVALIGATRGHPLILRGASPRATLSLTAMAKAVAYVQRRDYVVPKDIQVTFPQVIAHRLLLAPEADARQIGPEQILAGDPAPGPGPQAVSDGQKPDLLRAVLAGSRRVSQLLYRLVLLLSAPVFGAAAGFLAARQPPGHAPCRLYAAAAAALLLWAGRTVRAPALIRLPAAGQLLQAASAGL